MKNKGFLIATIIELIICLSAIILFIILLINGENVSKWIPALILAIFLVVQAIIEIIKYNKKG